VCSPLMGRHGHMTILLLAYSLLSPRFFHMMYNVKMITRGHRKIAVGTNSNTSWSSSSTHTVKIANARPMMRYTKPQDRMYVVI
jgi:hypothetical protein